MSVTTAERRLGDGGALHRRSIGIRALAFTGAVLFGFAATPDEPVHAQTGGDGFLFKPPVGSFSFRAGVYLPRAQGDIFDHTTRHLTLNRSDFTGAHVSLDLGIRANERVDMVLGMDFSGMISRSEFREWEDNRGNPVEQDTRFRTAALHLGAKFYLFDRGRRVSRFVWVPRTANLYFGGGAGYSWYEWDQHGDWVDYETLDIFYDRLYTDGGGFAGHAMAGAVYGLSQRLALNMEARYRLARGPISTSDFAGFTDGMDMSGFGVAVGLTVNF